MKPVQVTEQNFAETVTQGIVPIDFWAAWSGPCRAFAPVFDAAAARHPGVRRSVEEQEREAPRAASAGGV